VRDGEEHPPFFFFLDIGQPSSTLWILDPDGTGLMNRILLNP